MSDPIDLDDNGAGFGKATRREALKAMGLAAAAGAPFLTSLFAAGSAAAQTATDYKALVCVFMFGGNDNANTVVPRSGVPYADYQRARPALAIDASTLRALTPTGWTGPELGLSPHLPRLQGLFEAGQAGIVANVGTLVQPTTRAQYLARTRLPFQLFSHSDQQRAWETGLPDNPASRTGWLGRLGDVMGPAFNGNSPVSIAMSLAGNNLMQAGVTTQQYQLTTQGPVAVTGIRSTLYTSSAAANAMRTLMTQSRAHLFEAEYTAISARAISTESVLGAALTAAPPLTTTFGTSRLSAQAQMVARMIALRNTIPQRRQIFFIGVGGWDFHDNLLTDQQTRLSELDDAIASLYAATVALGVSQNVTIFTASDFGRALQFNGRGSDHGWGSHHFVVGGAVQGRRVYGAWPTVAIGGPEDAGQGRLVPTTSVDQYAATLCSWFGADSNTLAVALPNLSRFPSANLGFLT